VIGQPETQLEHQFFALLVLSNLADDKGDPTYPRTVLEMAAQLESDACLLFSPCYELEFVTNSHSLG